MSAVLFSLCWNVGLASVLALIVGALCRFRPLQHRPALVHTLWLLVLVKLVTPPLIPVPMLAHAQPNTVVVAEREDSADSRQQATLATEPRGPLVEPDHRAITPANHEPLEIQALVSAAAGEIPWLWLLAGISMCGTFILASVSVSRFLRVARIVRRAACGDKRLVRLAGIATERMGLRRGPRVCAVDAPIVPFLWAWFGGPVVVLPAKLVEPMRDDQVTCILCHELAHFARKDHWANWFAFVVATLFWWLPVAWWVWRQMRAAQEVCCDGLVLETEPADRRCYAEALFQALEFVQNCHPLRPNVAVGFGDSSSLRRRFQMIATLNVKPQVSRFAVMLAVASVAAMLCIPVRGQPPAATQGRSASEEKQDPSQPKQKNEQGPPKNEQGPPMPKNEPAQPNAEPEKKVLLTPEEAIKQMPKENVTVQFKVASVELDLSYLYSGFGGVPYLYLKDGSEFTAALICRQSAFHPDQLKKLGIERDEDFQGKIVRVTGRVESLNMKRASPKGMFVRSIAHLEVVQPKTEGPEGQPDEEQKPNGAKQPVPKEPSAEQPQAKGGPPDARQVLTPDEAMKLMPKENVTVQFKVASVKIDGPYSGFPLTYYICLDDGGKFTARLIDNAFTPLDVRMKQLGLEKFEDFKGKVVRVTGRVETDSDKSLFLMSVRSHADIEIVKTSLPGDKETKADEKKADEKKTAAKEQRVLSPEEAIKQMPEEAVTVEFKVASVRVTPAASDANKYYPVPPPTIILTDGGQFAVSLTAPVRKAILRSGIDPVKHFSGKVVRVTGVVQHRPGESSFYILVSDLNQFALAGE